MSELFFALVILLGVGLFLLGALAYGLHRFINIGRD